MTRGLSHRAADYGMSAPWWGRMFLPQKVDNDPLGRLGGGV
jgi:hypothetical protein